MADDSIKFNVPGENTFTAPEPKVPTTDELFGKDNLPTTNDLFDKPRPIEGWQVPGENWIPYEESNPGVKRVLDKFMDNFGTQPIGLDDNAVNALRKLGVFNDYEKTRGSIGKTALEAAVRPAAAALDLFLRGSSAGYLAAQQAGIELGLPKDVVSIPDAFMGSPHPTGIPKVPGVGPGSLLKSGIKPVTLPELQEAKDLGVIGSGEAGWKGTTTSEALAATEADALRNQKAAIAADRANAPETPAAPVQTPTLDSVARDIAPDTFQEYDRLREHQADLRSRLEQAHDDYTERLLRDAPQNDKLAAAQERLAEIQDESGKHGLKTKLQQQIEELTKDREAWIDAQPNSADIEMLGKQAVDLNNQVFSLGGDVREAYAAAREHLGQIDDIHDTYDIHGPQLPGEAPKAAEVTSEGLSATSKMKTDAPVTEAPKFQTEAGTFHSIKDDVSQRLVQLGRSKEEADAAAAIVEARYRTRAAQFEGAKGTAEELYKAEAPKLIQGKSRKRPDGQEAKSAKAGDFGYDKDGNATIRLFESADPSTFMHESAHSWLEEIVRDADDPRAPASLRQDRNTLLDWFGVEKSSDIKRRHHEKFANGFEKYLMEGRAPTPELTSVFAKFRNWLRTVYETVVQSRVKINNDIRDVFDRLLSPQPDRQPVGIVEDRGGAPEALAAEQRRRFKTPKKPTKPNDPLPADTSKTDKAGNIVLKNINAPQDVIDVLRKTADANGGFEVARRGTLTDAQVRSLAEASGLNPKSLNRKKIGSAYSAEEIAKLESMLIDSAATVRDAMKKAAEGSDEDVVAYAEASTRHRMIQEKATAARAEAGRALRVYQTLKQGPGSDLQLVNNVVRDVTGKTLNQLRAEAKLGASLDTPGKVSKFVHDMSKPTYTDMVVETWINALLSGPRTHMTNIMSNTLVALNSLPETAAAAAVGKVRELAGNKGDRVYMGEVGARAYGLVRGSQEGVIAGWEILKNEDAVQAALNAEAKAQALRENLSGDAAKARVEELLKDPTARMSKMAREISENQKSELRKEAVPGALGKAIRTPGRLLAAEDQVFKSMAFRSELNSQAYRQAMKEGREGNSFSARVADLVANPTEEMLKAAQDFADYQTFNKELGAFGQSVQRLANSHPLVRFLLPFIRTPSNIVKFTAERSVFGFLSREVKDNLKGNNGKIAQDQAIARMGMGTAVSVGAFSLALQGMITGGGPTDPAKRSMMYATGWQPYSVKIGDTYYSYARMEPLGTLLGVAADLADVGHAIKEEEYDKVAGLMLASVSKNLTNKTWLQGPATFFQAILDPDRYGESWSSKFVASFVPSVVNQTAQSVDPYLREARGIIEEGRSRIPFDSTNLMPKRDVWGEPIRRTDALGPDILSPINTSPANPDKVNKTLLDLEIYPAKLQKKIRGVDLTEQQYDDYARIGGRLAKTQLNQIVNMPGFDRLPNFVKNDMITKTIKSARDTAQNVIMMQNPGIVQQSLQNKKDEITQ